MDGEGHNDIIQAEYDRERDLFLNAFGVKVLRFDNSVVYDHPEGLLASVVKAFGWSTTTPPTAPLLEKEGNEKYEDVAGYCKSATLADIQKNDYILTPGRYVGVAEEEDDGIPFEEKMTDLTATLKAQMTQAEQLDADIRENLKLLGYE